MLKFLKSFEPRVLMIVAAVIGAIWVFLHTADEVSEGETDVIDRRLLLALRVAGNPSDPLGSRKIEDGIRDITSLGGTVVLTLVSVVALLAFLFHRKRLHAAVFLGAIVVAQLGTDLLKPFFDRPRPDLVPHGSYVYTGSFPSGHALHAASVYLTLAMLISSLETRRATKAMAFVVAGLLMVAVGFSRVYLGVHWPSDVLGGWCLGAAIALVAWAVLLRLGGRPKPAID